MCSESTRHDALEVKEACEDLTQLGEEYQSQLIRGGGGVSWLGFSSQRVSAASGASKSFSFQLL